MSNGSDKEVLVIQSKVKEYIRSQEMMCASDLMEALNERVIEALDEAVARAKENGRKTVRGVDA